MKKYFCSLLKKNLIPLACLTLICFAVYVVPVMVKDYSWWHYWDYRYESDLYLGFILTALVIMSVLIPIYLLSYKMNKRSVDMYYSLPISKTKILAAHFLVGLVLLYAPYSVAYLWGFVTVVIKTQQLYQQPFLINYLYLYLSSLLPAFILYSVTAFIYTRANTIIDGVICVVGALFLLSMAVSMLDEIGWVDVLKSTSYRNWFDAEDFYPFASLIQAANAFGESIAQGIPHDYDQWFANPSRLHEYISMIVSDILWALIGIASTIGLFLTEKNAKAENCGQISESIFCFKVLIPAYAAMAMVRALVSAIIELQNVALLFAVAFGAYLLSVIYKRTLKIGWRYAIVLGASVIGGILFFLVSIGLGVILYS